MLGYDSVSMVGNRLLYKMRQAMHSGFELFELLQLQVSESQKKFINSCGVFVYHCDKVLK